MDERQRALAAAHEAADAFFSGLDERPVWPRASIDDMLAEFDEPLPDEGADAADVVADLARRADPGLVGIPGGRFFGFVIGGSLPAAVAADWLVSAWDQNSGSSSMTTATVALEQTAGRWMLELFGLPAEASVGFVTGAQMSNFVCLATARHALLRRQGWDLAVRGVRDSPAVPLVVGRDRHGSIDRGRASSGTARRSSSSWTPTRRGGCGRTGSHPRSRGSGMRRRSCACRRVRCTRGRSTPSRRSSRSPGRTTHGCTSTAPSGCGPRRRHP